VNDLCALFGSLALWWPACVPPHPGAFDPALFGYAETTAGRSLAGEAIGKANSIVDSREHVPLAAGWDKAAWMPESVPVHLIGASAEMIFVPRGCRCVVVSVPAIQAWLAGASDAAKNDMAVDGASVLTFMLLHELGHIAHGDQADSAFAPYPARAADTNLVPTAEKTREFAADAWAAEHLKEAFMPGHRGFFASMSVQMALTSVSWNLARRRLIDNFGATVLRDPRVLFDAGYSHPNFELRILVANELVSASPAAKALRDEFERMREVQQ
jgi:hypothetical protein